MTAVYETLCINCVRDKGTTDLVCPLCGYDERTWRDHLLLLRPRTLLVNGRYVLGRSLGKGGFGITYIGLDTKLRRKVVIKEYFPSALAIRDVNRRCVISDPPDKEVYFCKGMKSFLKEAKVVAQFAQLPNIVNVYEHFEENNTSYIVMEHLEGQNLSEYLQDRGGRIPLNEAIWILLPILDVLHELHASNVYHRDISPQNIIIRNTGDPVLVDFGAARYIVDDESRSSESVIKEGYSPLEQYSSVGKIGPWTDVYACGATLYRMISGERPPASIERHQADRLHLPSKFSTQDYPIPAQFDDIILQAVAVRIGDRFQTVKAFQQALQHGMEPVSVKKDKPGSKKDEFRPATPNPKKVSESRVKPEQESSKKFRSIPAVMFGASVVLLMFIGAVMWFILNENAFYELTPQALYDLTHEAIAIKVYEDLYTRMKGRRFETRTGFLNALQDAIGKYETTEYQRIIVQHARHKENEPPSTQEPELPPLPIEGEFECTYKNIQVVLSQEEFRQDPETGYRDEIDGLWGPKTRTVLEEFQQQRHLNVTGKINVATCVEMKPLFDTYKDDILKYQSLSCFAPFEYEKLFEDLPEGKELLENLVIERLMEREHWELRHRCIYVDNISKEQQELLGSRIYDEIVRKAEMNFEPVLPPIPPLPEPIPCTYKNIQVVLSQRRFQFYRDSIDGRWGADTESALKIFQRRNGIVDSGKITDETCLEMAPLFEQYSEEIATYQRWSCFESSEYKALFQEPLEDSPALAELFIRRFVKIKSTSGLKRVFRVQCMYIDRLSDEHKELLGSERYDEIVRRVEMAPE